MKSKGSELEGRRDQAARINLSHDIASDVLFVFRVGTFPD